MHHLFQRRNVTCPKTGNEKTWDNISLKGAKNDIKYHSKSYMCFFFIELGHKQISVACTVIKILNFYRPLLFLFISILLTTLIELFNRVKYFYINLVLVKVSC